MPTYIMQITRRIIVGVLEARPVPSPAIAARAGGLRSTAGIRRICGKMVGPIVESWTKSPPEPIHQHRRFPCRSDNGRGLDDARTGLSDLQNLLRWSRRVIACTCFTDDLRYKQSSRTFISSPRIIPGCGEVALQRKKKVGSQIVVRRGLWWAGRRVAYEVRWVEARLWISDKQEHTVDPRV